MSKLLLMAILLTLFTIEADAAVYKGQRVFLKKCLGCHSCYNKSGEDFMMRHTQKEWDSLMVQKGKPLAELHLKSKKAKKSWNYFQSAKYTKKAKHLREFLMNYAKDSGNIPACN